MQRLAAGEELALNRLMERWKERVAAFLLRMTGEPDAARDLAQETFVRLYQSRHRYRPKGRFSTYLFAIASNLAKNHLRWRSRHPARALSDEEAAQLPAQGQGPDAALAQSETAAAVERAFAALPPEQREAMTLFIHEELGYAEIAAALGCSAKAVETRIYRARQRLRELLA